MILDPTAFGLKYYRNPIEILDGSSISLINSRFLRKGGFDQASLSLQRRSHFIRFPKTKFVSKNKTRHPSFDTHIRKYIQRDNRRK